MCDKHQPPVITSVAEANAAQEAQASRRRRLWELGHACHCPLVGVGLPLGVLRKLVDKAVAAGRPGGQVVADDYEVHVGAVSECGTRNPCPKRCKKNWNGATPLCCCASAPPRARRSWPTCGAPPSPAAT